MSQPISVSDVRRAIERLKALKPTPLPWVQEKFGVIRYEDILLVECYPHSPISPKASSEQAVQNAAFLCAMRALGPVMLEMVDSVMRYAERDGARSIPASNTDLYPVASALVEWAAKS